MKKLYYCRQPLSVSITNGPPTPFLTRIILTAYVLLLLFQSPPAFPRHLNCIIFPFTTLFRSGSIPNGPPTPFRLSNIVFRRFVDFSFNPQRASHAISTGRL